MRCAALIILMAFLALPAGAQYCVDNGPNVGVQVQVGTPGGGGVVIGYGNGPATYPGVYSYPGYPGYYPPVYYPGQVPVYNYPVYTGYPANVPVYRNYPARYPNRNCRPRYRRR